MKQKGDRMNKWMNMFAVLMISDNFGEEHVLYTSRWVSWCYIMTGQEMSWYFMINDMVWSPKASHLMKCHKISPFHGRVKPIQGHTGYLIKWPCRQRQTHYFKQAASIGAVRFWPASLYFNISPWQWQYTWYDMYWTRPRVEHDVIWGKHGNGINKEIAV